MNEYTCNSCGETYEKIRSDEECWKEFHEIMPEAVNDDIAILCDDCWLEFMEWFKTLSNKQKNKILDNYI